MLGITLKPARLASLVATSGLLFNATIAQAHSGFDIQPVVDGKGHVEWVEKHGSAFGRTGKVLKVAVEEGRAGYAVENMPKHVFHIVDYSGRQTQCLGRAVFITFIDQDTSMKNVVVRFYFKRHHGMDEITTIEVPLTKFKIEQGQGDYRVASISIKDVFGNYDGVPNLKRASVVLQKPGKIEFGDIKLCITDFGCDLIEAERLQLDTKGADHI